MEPDVPYLVSEITAFVLSFCFIVGLTGIWAALLLPTKAHLHHQISVLDGVLQASPTVHGDSVVEGVLDALETVRAQTEVDVQGLRNLLRVLTELLAPLAWLVGVFVYLPAIGSVVGAICAVPVAWTAYDKVKDSSYIADLVLQERAFNIVRRIESERQSI